MTSIYTDLFGNVASVEGKSDREVVLTFWGNSQYKIQTKDITFDHVPKRVRDNWRKVHILSGDAIDEWHALRADFEEHGFSD